MQAAPAVGIRHIAAVGRALHLVPHPPLYAQRAGSVIDDEVIAGPQFVQQLLGFGHLVGHLGQEEGFVQVVVQHLAREVVGGGVHQMHPYGGVHLLYIHQPEGTQRGFRRRVGGNLGRGVGHDGGFRGSRSGLRRARAARYQGKNQYYKEITKHLVVFYEDANIRKLSVFFCTFAP